MSAARSQETRLRELVAQGLSDPAIAPQLGVSARTVLRWRHALGIGSEWVPPLPPHGTATRYQRPHRCRCVACRAANTAAMVEWREAQQRVTAPMARRSTEPWTAAEDAQLLDSDLTVAALARNLGRSYDATRKRRERLRNGTAVTS